MHKPLLSVCIFVCRVPVHVLVHRLLNSSHTCHTSSHIPAVAPAASAGHCSRPCCCCPLEWCLQLTFTKPHILLLDEPSNHLDIDAVDALIQGLAVFKGGVLMVGMRNF